MKKINIFFTVMLSIILVYLIYIYNINDSWTKIERYVFIFCLIGGAANSIMLIYQKKHNKTNSQLTFMTEALWNSIITIRICKIFNPGGISPIIENQAFQCDLNSGGVACLQNSITKGFPTPEYNTIIEVLILPALFCETFLMLIPQIFTQNSRNFIFRVNPCPPWSKIDFVHHCTVHHMPQAANQVPEFN